MSCISEILKVKGDKDFLLLDRFVVEDGGIYKGYEYLITFVEIMAHRCGYVAISKDNKLYDKDLMDLECAANLSVHGGITFNDSGAHITEAVLNKKISCTDRWIGFDAMHAYDLPDIECYKKYFIIRPLALESMESLAKCYERETKDAIRDKPYMVDQCKSLIDQIIEINNG